MPRGKRNAAKDARADVNANRPYYCAADATWGGFINLRVEPDERADFDGWRVEEAKEMAAMLDRQLVAGLKYSLSYDAENSAYIATFTGAGALGSGDRCSLSARAGDWWEATELLLYKHLVILDGDWGRYRPSNGTVAFG